MVLHGDARDVNFLINKEEIYLIDWEYGGYGAPALISVPMFVAGRILWRTLTAFFLHIIVTHRQKFKRDTFSLISLLLLVLHALDDAEAEQGQFVGIRKEQWYHFAKTFSLISLPMYGVEVDKDEYEKAMEAAIECKLEDLSFMNNGIESIDAEEVLP